MLFVPFTALYSAVCLVCTFVPRTTWLASWRQSLCLIYSCISIYWFPENSPTYCSPNTSAEVIDVYHHSYFHFQCSSNTWKSFGAWPKSLLKPYQTEYVGFNLNRRATSYGLFWFFPHGLHYRGRLSFH